jgi:hypothetical protein
MDKYIELIRSMIEAIDQGMHLDQPVWRLISLIVSPIVSLVAFYLGLRGRWQLQRQAENLGELRERVKTAQERLASEERLVGQKAAEIERLQRDISLLTERSHELWKIRDAAPFPELYNWQEDPSAARVVAFGNLKGGCSLCGRTEPR